MRALCIAAGLAIGLTTIALAVSPPLLIPDGLATGVYISDKGQWKKLPVESVDWKSVHQSAATGHTGFLHAGFLRAPLGHNDGAGLVQGKGSSLIIPGSTPVDLLIRGPWQLVRFHGHKAEREFHESEHSHLTFTTEKAGDDIWRGQLDMLSDGEYGLILDSDKTRVYTFSIIGGNDSVRLRERRSRGNPGLDF